MNWEIYELIAYLAKQKDPILYKDIKYEDLESFIYHEYGIDIQNFIDLIENLLPLCDVAKSPLIDTIYQGFGTGSFWLVKKEKDDLSSN